jgi:hypothetical protein
MDKEKTELAIWLKTFTVFISAIVSSVAFFVYINRNIIFNRAAGSNGSITFVRERENTKMAGEFSTQLILNTDNAQVRGTDVRIQFDRSKLELIRLVPSARQATSLHTYLPLKENTFDAERVIREANDTGFIEFSALTVDMDSQTATASFKGVAVLADLAFRSLQEGRSTIRIINAHPTHDSTIVENTNPPQNILTKTNELSISSAAIIPTLLKQPEQ